MSFRHPTPDAVKDVNEFADNVRICAVLLTAREERQKILLLEFDLSGAEFVVTGFLAPEPAMIDIFRSGKSPHIVTGSRLTGLSELLVAKDHEMISLKNDPEEIQAIRRKEPEIMRARWLPRTMSIRQAAKKANFGLNYREGYRTFALKNEMDERDAKRAIELYRGTEQNSNGCAYPGLLKWYERIDKTIRDCRKLTNCFGRTVYFSGALNDETFRKATAFVPQSTVFDITAKAMPLLMDDETPDFMPAQLLIQDHDSLVTQYRSRDFNAMARYAIRLGLDYMSPVLRYNEMDFTLGVGLKAGLDWGHTEEIKLTSDADVLASRLKNVYEKQKKGAGFGKCT